MRTLSRNEQARFGAELNIIRPQLIKAGWREGQILHRRPFVPNRKAPSFTLQHWQHFPLAAIRFVEDNESLITALDHAISWADTENGGFDIDFLFSTNGVGFEEFDKTNGQRRFLELPEFPSPRYLWGRSLTRRGLRPGQGHKLDCSSGSHLNRNPWYFEAIAQRRILEAVLKGQRRMALIIGLPASSHFLMAHLVSHLWGQRLAKRFLYLPDWHSLMLSRIPQHFRYSNCVIDDLKGGQHEKQYQAFVVIPDHEKLIHNLWSLPPDYFDIVVVDEFRRLTEKGNTMWQALLKHFHPATHIGLTSLSHPIDSCWFGDLIYRYTLSQLEQDGFRPEIMAKRAYTGQLRRQEVAENRKFSPVNSRPY